MTNTLAVWFAENLGQVLSPVVVIFLVSMIPILELRGGLIVASLLHVKMWTAIPVCIAGNLLPVPFALLLLEKILEWMKKKGILKGFVNWLEQRALNKSDSIRKYEFIGLMLFVGIPLPGTGAWSGSLIASMRDMDRNKSVGAILLGLILATIIMTVISYGILGQVW